jgi:hypothetical protein
MADEKKEESVMQPSGNADLGVTPGIVDGTKEGIPEKQEDAPKTEKREEPVSQEPQPVQEAGQQKKEEDLKSYRPDGRDQSYGELEKKLTEYGQQNAEYRQFYEETMPVLQAIQDDPKLLDEVLAKLYPDQKREETPQIPVEDMSRNKIGRAHV